MVTCQNIEEQSVTSVCLVGKRRAWVPGQVCCVQHIYVRRPACAAKCPIARCMRNCTVIALHCKLQQLTTCLTHGRAVMQICAVLQIVCGGADSWQQALREVDIMSRNLHPCIMPLVQHRAEPDGDGGTLYMLMPLCSGGSLWDYVEARQAGKQCLQVPTREVLSVAAQVRTALLTMALPNVGCVWSAPATAVVGCQANARRAVASQGATSL